jgi:hypothetical protein
MNGVAIGVGIGFWVLMVGLAFYTNHRRRTRWSGGSQPMTPPNAGSFESPGPTPEGMGYGPQSPFNSPQPQPPARPGPLLFFKMIAPSRPTKILLAIAALLALAGLLIMIIATRAADGPNFLPLVFSGGALCFVGGLIWAGLLIATTLRQRKGWRPEGWPPR